MAKLQPDELIQMPPIIMTLATGTPMHIISMTYNILYPVRTNIIMQKLNIIDYMGATKRIIVNYCIG